MTFWYIGMHSTSIHVSMQKNEYGSDSLIYVTGPAIINHVSTNYSKLSLLMSSALNVVSLFRKFQKKPIKFCGGDI